MDFPSLPAQVCGASFTTIGSMKTKGCKNPTPPFCTQALLQHPQTQQSECLSTSVQQQAAPSDQGTVWCASVTLEYTPRAALGSVPTILIQDSTGGKFEHSQLSAHILSLHWLFSTSKSPPAISKSNTHFSSVCCRPSAASHF